MCHYELMIYDMLFDSCLVLSCCKMQDIMAEVSRREKEAKIVPDPDVDTYMKAISVKGQNTTLQTDYILKVLSFLLHLSFIHSF